MGAVDTPLLTRPELAAYFQVTTRTIKNWEELGRIERAVWSPPRYDLQDCLNKHKAYSKYRRKEKKGIDNPPPFSYN